MELSCYALSPLREGDFTLYRGSCNGMGPILVAAAERCLTLVLQAART
jgi:hypothetical protein